jgi:mRNA-degrading endonuclease RelE of RelBE toxin-antitoxin system
MGAYRVILEIDDTGLLIFILKGGTRKKGYNPGDLSLPSNQAVFI